MENHFPYSFVIYYSILNTLRALCSNKSKVAELERTITRRRAMNSNRSLRAEAQPRYQLLMGVGGVAAATSRCQWRLLSSSSSRCQWIQASILPLPLLIGEEVIFGLQSPR
jgi:hypothetical protein